MMVKIISLISFSCCVVVGIHDFAICRVAMMTTTRERTQCRSQEPISYAKFNLIGSRTSNVIRHSFFCAICILWAELELFVFMLNFVASSLSPRCVWECCGAEVETETELYVKIFIHFCGNFHLSKCNLWLKSREKSPRSEI